VTKRLQKSTLFRLHSVEDYFEQLRERMYNFINDIPAEEIEQVNPETLAAEIAQPFCVTCPVLNEQQINYDKPPFNPGTRSVTVSLYVPFTGSHEMFRCHGSQFPALAQQFKVEEHQLIIYLDLDRREISQLPEKVRALLVRVKDGLENIDVKLKHLNPDLAKRAAARVRERQAEIASHKQLLGDLEKTGFSLRRRNDGAESVIVPVKPKAMKIQARPVADQPSRDPELSMPDYDEILNVIRSMAKVYERSPSVFRKMEEEHLRTILLVGLNGLFKGNATGETFNGEGRNDILIRVNDNNIFIAECLFWDGPAKFRGKITEQLLRYSTWHDSKLAAIVFNRTKNFTAVVHKMREVAAGLENRITEMPYPEPNSCRHRFRREDDPQKQYVLTCTAFEVPS
jgi:hypothetical protein